MISEGKTIETVCEDWRQSV